MVCSCYNLKDTRLGEQAINRNGGPWEAMCHSLEENEEFGKIVMASIWMNVGNRKGRRFWEDRWIAHEKLQNKFPRLYPISLQKEKSISECGL